MGSRIDKDAEKIVAAIQAGELRPVLSTEAPLDLETAYKIQAQVISRSGMAIAGFKAALSNTAGQKAMGVTEPVFGVLPQSGQASAGDLINLKKFHGPVIEAEIGYRVATPVVRAVNPDTVLGHIGSVLPVFEIADPAFAAAKTRTGADLIAVNSAAAAFVPGEDTEWDSDLDDISVVMSRNNEQLTEGRATDAMGGQINALCWLINKVLKYGYVLEPGHLLMTGALGGPQVGLPGRYLGDYGNFGRIEFEFIHDT